MDNQDHGREVLTQSDFQTRDLGENTFDSPLQFPDSYYRDGGERVLFNNTMDRDKALGAGDLLSFERAGPWKKLHFDPAMINVGIVTCGGLCPGLNDVIRSITYGCLQSYGVKNVYGFRFGFEGLTTKHSHEALSLTHSIVEVIHQEGGTILGSSRGPQSITDMVDTLVKFNISILFVIGGDGTQHGTMGMVEEITRRKLNVALVGVPKTIDNDISYVAKTFGFSTAVEQARKAVNAAHVEAKGARNGIGLVKLMGRHSGWIASHVTHASGNVNICLIPEVPLDLDDLFARILKRFQRSDHVVIVVAEGVGQDLMRAEMNGETDASGNLKLGDIGVFLKAEIGAHLKRQGVRHTLKYIDPSYMIRSTPANAEDSAFCLNLGSYAVHAGMAGRTNVMLGYWNQHFTLVPIELAVSKKKTVRVDSALWQSIRAITC